MTINISYCLILGGATGTAYEYPYAHEGVVEITRYDLKNRIVSGRFNAILKMDDCDDVEITEGRFDLKMQKETIQIMSTFVNQNTKQKQP